MLKFLNDRILNFLFQRKRHLFQALLIKLSNGKWFVKTFLRTLGANGMRAAADEQVGSPCEQASVRQPLQHEQQSYFRECSAKIHYFRVIF